MSIDEIKALVRRFAEEPWSTGNLAVFDEVCSPDYVIHDLDGTLGNLDSIKKAVQDSRAQVPDLTSRVNDIIINGERVAYGWTMRGTDGGKHMKMVGMTFLLLKDGKIIDDSYVRTEVIPEEQPV